MPDIFTASKTVDNKKKTAPVAKPKLKKNIKTKPKVKKKDVHTLPGHTRNPFSAFSYYPDRVKFVNEDPEEKVILLIRNHPITNTKWIATGFLMLIAPFFASAFILFDFVPFRFVLVGVIVWYLATFSFMFEKFLSWFFHVNIITDERIIEVDFTHLLYREITDANIDHIEDVTVEMAGSIRTFFNFGKVEIQTAAEVPKIDFEAVPYPDRVARILRDLRIEEEQEKIEGRVR